LNLSLDNICVIIKGQVQRPGTYAVHDGENILDVIFGHAGGMAESRFSLKAVLVGGTLGRFAGPDEFKAPLTASHGAMVFDTGSCLVNAVRLLLLFNRTVLTAAEYQGCPFCKAALANATALLARLCTPQGSSQDFTKLVQLAEGGNPACPGHCAALAPLASALQIWEEEFAEHAAGHCRASICSELMLSPCANSCPADVDLPGTVALMQRGQFSDALALGRHDNPLFLSCGSVCEEPPCQKNCKRLSFDDPIYSQSLHRYAGEKAAQAAGGLKQALQHTTIKAGAPSGKTVAVVGAGPAGLAVAYFLARLGHKAEVFDKNPRPGGMTFFGIPAYRLSRAVVTAEIEAIQSLGVEIRSSQTLGREITLPGLQAEYDAVLLALGNSVSRGLGLPGEDLAGVIPAVDFLHQVALSGEAPIGRRVLVVGGGNVAVDAARTARRLGAEHVGMMCVEDRHEMPASPNEIAAAVAEGIVIQVLSVPLAFSGDGRVIRVSFTAITPGPYDSAGRRWPPAPRREEVQEQPYDTVIIAIGQTTDLDCLAGSGVGFRGPFITCDASQATCLPGVFAAGDCAGPLNSVVKAVGSGKAAALAIDRYLTGSSRPLQSPLRSSLGCWTGDYTWAAAQRAAMPEQAVPDRIHNFNQVELGLDDAQARHEMLRCICAAKGGR